MKNYSITLPSYSIGGSVYQKIPQICGKSGTKAVIIGGKLSLEAAVDKIKQFLCGIFLTGTLLYGGESSEENIRLLCDNAAVREADMIFAVGGGKAIDTCKAAGELTNKPVYAFPTIASNCAATTAVSIIYNPDGTFLRPFFLSSPPCHTFIDTEILAAAPKKYVWAGIGDTIAKYYEARMSSDGEVLTHYHQLGCEVSRMCADPVYRWGKKAVEDNEKACSTYEFEQIVLAVIVSTGIASILLTAEHTIDYNTGLAHAIFNSLTSFPRIEKNHLHGELVCFGVLLLLLVWEKDDEFEHLYSFMQSIHLPVSPDDIELSAQDISKIIPLACTMPDISHSAYEITADKLSAAFEKLVRYNISGKLNGVN